MRSYHSGPTPSSKILDTRAAGIVRLLRTVIETKKDGSIVVMRPGELAIVDEAGCERERHRLVVGATLRVVDGARVEPGDALAEWNQRATPVLSDVSGRVRYRDLIDGVSVHEHVDAATGLSSKVVRWKSADLRPRITITDPVTGQTLALPNSELKARYLLPVGARILAQEGETIEAGEVLAEVPRMPSRERRMSAPRNRTPRSPTQAAEFVTRRPLSIWDYRATHSQLLLRGSWLDGEEADEAWNLDLLFLGVDYVDLRARLPSGARIFEAGPPDRDRVLAAAGLRDAAFRRVFRLEPPPNRDPLEIGEDEDSSERPNHVVASALWVVRTTSDDVDSPFVLHDGGLAGELDALHEHDVLEWMKIGGSREAPPLGDR
jgi:hypothetical protein